MSYIVIFYVCLIWDNKDILIHVLFNETKACLVHILTSKFQIPITEEGNVVKAKNQLKCF